MSQRLAHTTLVVDDYDRAIEFYTKKLGFKLLEDTLLSETKRWVIVAPNGSACSLLLARAANEVQESRIGNQTGGRVSFFLYTDDIHRDYDNLLKNAVTIVRLPAKEAWGTVLVFADLYGNLWDLIEPLST